MSNPWAHLRTVDEVDRELGIARTVLHAQRNHGGVIGLHRVRVQIDNLLDRRLQLTGPPVCSGAACGRVMSRFGTGVHLCSACDFIECQNIGCSRRVMALDSDVCNPCRGAVTP